MRVLALKRAVRDLPWKALLWALPAVATWLGGLLFLGISFDLIVEWVHAFNPSARRLWLFSEAMHDTSPLPVVLAVAIVVYFAVDRLLRAVRRQSRPSAWFGTSGLFLFGSGAVLAAYAVFWLTDGPHITGYAGGPNPYLLTLLVFSAGLAGGIIAGVAVRFLPGRYRLLCFLPPLATFLALPFLDRYCATYWGGDWESQMWLQLGAMFGAALIACALLAWAEGRLRGSRQRSSGLFCAALWAFAAFGAALVQAGFGCMCTQEGPKDVERAAAILVAAGLVLAVGIRLFLHLRRD